MDCSLCDSSLGPIIVEGDHWRLVLNHNQNLLGKCFLVTRRHVEDVRNLTEAEWLELHRRLADTADALGLAFHPDHLNYAFLQNQDRHVHLHIIPRYAEAQTFEGSVFHDPGYPGHYEIDGLPNRLPPYVAEKLAQVLGQFVRQVRATDQQ